MLSDFLVPDDRQGLSTILAVDPDLGELRLLRGLLGGAGYTCLAVRTATHALAVAMRTPEPLDVLLIDVDLPDAPAREIADRIRGAWPLMKVLYLAHPYSPSAAGLAPREILPKPLVSGTILQAVRDIWQHGWR